MEDSKKSNRLIEAVKKEEVLWDRNHNKYYDSKAKVHLWRAVAKQAGFNSDKDAIRRWRLLRDRFVRQLRKLHCKGSIAAVDYKCAWPYFNKLLFLQQTVEFRSVPKLEENYNILNGDDQDSTETTEFNLPEYVNVNFQKCKNENENESNNQEEEKICDDSINGFALETNVNEEIQRELLQIESKKQELQQQEQRLKEEQEQDGNLHFFKSLLPFINSMSPMSQLQVRAQIQDVIMQQISKSNANANECVQ